ncbi:hypothetical protein BTVI_30867 [Pitangus sulphuratus]|nr:hypothetical protein BTVI_30867 [Pitangus sulphuratus]
MHHKFAIVDRRVLITGSLNWTTQAIQSNRENVLVVDDAACVKPFLDEFERIWEEYNPANYSFPKITRELWFKRMSTDTNDRLVFKEVYGRLEGNGKKLFSGISQSVWRADMAGVGSPMPGEVWKPWFIQVLGSRCPGLDQ